MGGVSEREVVNMYFHKIYIKFVLQLHHVPLISSRKAAWKRACAHGTVSHNAPSRPDTTSGTLELSSTQRSCAAITLATMTPAMKTVMIVSRQRIHSTSMAHFILFSTIEYCDYFNHVEYLIVCVKSNYFALHFGIIYMNPKKSNNFILDRKCNICVFFNCPSSIILFSQL